MADACVLSRRTEYRQEAAARGVGGEMHDRKSSFIAIKVVSKGVALAVAAAWLPLAVSSASAGPIPEFVDPGAGAPVSVDANSLSYDKNGTTVVARGDVIITYGDYRLKADRVTYNPKTEKIIATGNVELREPDGAVLNAHRLELGDRFREGFIDQVAVVLVNNARINARSAERGDGVTNFRDVTYTACKKCEEDPTRPVTWKIKADRITHNKREQSIEYENARFDFLGVPIAYVPTFSHPDHTVKRKSGFLVPTASFSDEFGAGVEVPYFFNLAPNYDITFNPLLTTEQGPVLKGTWRHRLANGKYSITPTGVYQLKRDSETPGNDRFRGSVNTKGDFRLARNWTAGWDGTYVSDDTYLRRYNIDSTTDITSEIFLTGVHDRNYFDARAQHFKGLLDTDDNDATPYALPIVDHEYYAPQPILGGEFKVTSNYLNLQRTEGTDATRFVTQANWDRRMISSLGTVITPFANVRGDIYRVNNVADAGAPGGVRDAETIARVLPSAGLDVRWPFVSMTASGQHIIEPVAQVIARPNETDLNQLPNEDSLSFEFDDTNLFALNKFTGLDRWEGGTRANAGINYTYRFNSGGYAKASFGQSYQIAGKNSFDEDSGLEDDYSDFVGAFFLQMNENLLFTSRFRLDNQSFALRHNEFGLNARYGRLNFSANYAKLDKAVAFSRPNRQEEIFTQAALQITDSWTVYGGLRYNIEDKDLISNFAGVGFDDECFAVKIHYRETFVEDRDIDPERSVSLRFELKTIGSAGVSSGSY